MRVFFSIFGTAFLVAITAVLGALLLPSCGVLKTIVPTWDDWCPVSAQKSVDTRLAVLSDRTSELERLIASRERRLALLQCSRKPPVVAKFKPPEINREAWTARDLAALEGCWNLDSKFSTTDRQTGVSTRYATWRMCFDGAGNGREEMLAENGGTCSGTVRGKFNTNGTLSLDQPGNLQCSDGGFIYRLSSTCQLKGDGTADCSVTQPEPGRSTTINFRREMGNQ